MLHFRTLQLDENDKVRHSMTQIANLLAVAFVLWILISTVYSQGGGGLIRKTKLPMQELEVKVQGAYARGRGVIVGFYGTFCAILV